VLILNVGVRFVGNDRLGAERILQLRCLDASQKWDFFWADKAKKRKQSYFAPKQCWVLAA
jgi:hypothetical protein